ncbi:MAG TPA: hypothetical protein VF174_08970 [Micromonosporaceae bacterium]
MNETAPEPFMIGEQGPEEFPGTGFGAAQPQIDRMAAEGFEIVPAVQTAPETALRATETGERPELDLDRIAEFWLRQCGSCDAGIPACCTHPDEDYRPVMLRLVEEIRLLRGSLKAQPAALREAGWVDPEEAARLRSDYWRAREDRSQFMGERDEARATKDMHKERAQQAIAERDALLPVAEEVARLRGEAEKWRETALELDRQASHNMVAFRELMGQRDALVTVVEAARAYERAWTEFADGTVPPSDADQWTRVRVAKAQAHQVLLDSTRALDSGTREESTDG